MILDREEIDLRDEDTLECTLGGMTPFEALSRSVGFSTESYVARAPDGEVLMYWGFYRRGIVTGDAYVWALSTPFVDLWPWHTARESRRLLTTLLESFHSLTCLVDPSYERSIRWLEWLGFQPDGEEYPFLKMRISRGGLA